MEIGILNKRIVVLGSNSFAGSALVRRLLLNGANVIGLNRSNEGPDIFLQYKWSQYSGKYTFIKTDINNDINAIELLLNDFKPNFIVDFIGQGMVAESWENPDHWYQTNIVGKVRLHEILRKLTGLERYIRVSTPEVYGSNETAIGESWIFNPSTPYAVSHSAIDMSLRAYFQRYSFPVIFTRFANFYGPGQQLYRIIPRTIIYASTNKKLQLHGGGSSIRAFIYGEDVADAIERTIMYGKLGEIYHFSPNNFHTIKDIVKMITEYLGVSFDDLVEITADRPGKDQAYLMNSSRAREELGWTPKFQLEQGIENTSNWVKENLQEIKQLPLEYIHKV